MRGSSTSPPSSSFRRVLLRCGLVISLLIIIATALLVGRGFLNRDKLLAIVNACELEPREAYGNYVGARRLREDGANQRPDDGVNQRVLANGWVVEEAFDGRPTYQPVRARYWDADGVLRADELLDGSKKYWDKSGRLIVWKDLLGPRHASITFVRDDSLLPYLLVG